MRIAIIGSGIGGLSAAIKLGKAGHTVVVYEKNEVLGGRAGVLKENGFTFDLGPSWYLMPDVFERFYTSIGENIHDHLDLIKLDPAYRVYFEGDTKPLDIPSSEEAAAAVMESLEPGAGSVFKKYLKKTKRQYRLVVDHFLYHEYRTILDVISLKSFEALFALPLIGSIDRYVKKFFKSYKIRQLLEYTMVFLGASPYNAPALYAMMAYVDFGLGVYYSQGGIGKLIESLVSLGKKYGVTYEVNTAVDKIEVVEGRATGVVLSNGQKVAFDAVVSNADMSFTETKLLDLPHQTYKEKYWKKTVLAPSAVLLYLGVKGSLPQLNHHTLYFSKDWSVHFDAIFKNPLWPKNPCYYVSNPSKTDPSVAPAGHENVFILLPVAARFGTDQEVRDYAEYALDHIAETAGIPDLKERIVYKKVFGPNDFESRYNSQGGTALGMAHTFGQTAIFRPQNKSKKVSNLYYTGAGVHPGIGMPVCLISGELVAERIIKENK